ncbi:hypothetical protein MUK42_37230, partial [Musa troglodytarum]
VTIINFEQSRGSISFLCVVSKIQNINHSKLISLRETIQAWFHRKT